MTREEIISGLSALATQFPPFSEESKLIRGTLEALKQEPCDDAISRQAAIVALDDRMSNLENVDMQIAMGFAKGIINDLPPVNPQYTEAEIQKMQELEQAEIQKAYELGKAEQSKMGHWIAADDNNAICSYCNRLNHFYGIYCKHCGAKMVESQESEA